MNFITFLYPTFVKQHKILVHYTQNAERNVIHNYLYSAKGIMNNLVSTNVIEVLDEIHLGWTLNMLLLLPLLITVRHS